MSVVIWSLVVDVWKSAEKFTDPVLLMATSIRPRTSSNGNGVSNLTISAVKGLTVFLNGGDGLATDAQLMVASEAASKAPLKSQFLNMSEEVIGICGDAVAGCRS